MQVNPIEGEVTPADIQRFYNKVNKTEECWLWTAGSKVGWNDTRYGVFRFRGRNLYAHRFSLYMQLGVDPGPSTDHLCHVTLCVNPKHLKGGTIADNNWNRRCVISAYCARGHLRDGSRQCRECQRASWRKTSKKKYQKYKQNQTHSSEMKDFARNPKLDWDKVAEIRKLGAEGISQRQLARQFEVSQPMIGSILRNEAWKTM